MKQLITALLLGLILASTSALALYQVSDYGVVADKSGKGVAGGYDPYRATSVGNEAFRKSGTISTVTGNAVLGPRYYGNAYQNYNTVESVGSLWNYRKVLSKKYDPEQRAYRGTRSRANVLRDRADVKYTPVLVSDA